jgi:hypothetical protein
MSMPADCVETPAAGATFRPIATPTYSVLRMRTALGFGGFDERGLLAASRTLGTILEG